MPKSSRGALAGRTMPSILNRSVSQATSIQHPEFQSKNKFKTALGLPHNNNVSTASTLPHKRHSRSPSDIISQAFFVPVDSQEMKLAVPPQAQPSLATAVQRDLWNISVAESPHDSLNYSIYIKTPTHSLTLTRSAKEIVDLHAKLHETWPSQTLPSLPIDSDLLRSRPQKRRSSFLTTLSRLTSSPRSVKAHNVHSPTRSPSRTPAAEYQDPFGDDLDPAVVLNPTATATALASYLTTISNHSAFRTSRPWKRFVRVRTDDLESTRVERAIKRVKSDSGMRDGIGHDQPKTSAITPMDVLPRGSEADAKDPKEPDTPAPQPNGTVTPVDPDEEPLCDRGILDAIRTGPSTADLRLTTSIPEQPEETPTAAPAAESTASLSVSPTNTATSTAVRTETDRERETDQEHDGMTSSAGTTTASTMTTTSGGTTEPTSPDDAPSSPSASRKGEVEEEARPHPYTRIPRSASADPDKSMRRSRLWDSGPDGEMTETDADESGVEGPEKKIKKSRRPSGRKVVVDDFEMMRVLGKGCAGKVLLVRHRASSALYALKAITKRHVLAHQELQHTLTEQAVLKRMAKESKDSFVVKLWWSFHDKENLFLVMDFHPGGDLATQLARWGRLGRDRARFYAAEIVEGVEGLHAAGVIYRDLKPENILIGADGHIVLTDFGLSKEFPRPNGAAIGGSNPGGLPYWMGAVSVGAGSVGADRTAQDMTTTFCGTAEYLAPEVIQGLSYSYEVDWWSFGTMLYEMLSGITPFWANNHSDMYVRVLQDELHFPEDKAMDQETKSLIRGLLQRNPALRMSEPRIRKHPYFSMIDWSHVYHKRYMPPYVPPIDPLNASDTQNFDDAFLDMAPTILDEPDPDLGQQSDGKTEDEDESVATSATKPSEPAQKKVEDEDTVDVFDGYSFKGRHSVLIDDEEERDDGSTQVSEPVESELGDIDTEVEDEASSHRGLKEDRATTPVVHADQAPPTPITPASELEELTPTVLTPVTPSSISEPLPAADVTPTLTPTTPATTAAEDIRAGSVTPPPRVPPTQPVAAKQPRAKREKSGVPALDRFMSSIIDEDDEATAAERDEEEDDWDFVEAPGVEEANGMKTGGSSLFARGVVDRYRLAVFRKSSSSRTTSRDSTMPASPSPLSQSSSPTPSEGKARARRAGGLSLRKSTKQFLRPRSPATYSAVTSKSHPTSRPPGSTSTPRSFSGVAGFLLAPSQSSPLHASEPPSLKSKSSALSKTSGSSDNSLDELRSTSNPTSMPNSPSPSPAGPHKRTMRTSSSEEPERHKNLKKMKTGAEKMFSIFGSPKSQAQPQQ